MKRSGSEPWGRQKSVVHFSVWPFSAPASSLGPLEAPMIARSAATFEPLAAGWLAALVESADDAIVSKTLDGTIRSWNPAAQKLFGYTPEEVIGRPISILAAPDRENEMHAILERIRRGEKVDRYDTILRRKDGSLVDVSLTVSPIRDETGRI